MGQGEQGACHTIYRASYSGGRDYKYRPYPDLYLVPCITKQSSMNQKALNMLIERGSINSRDTQQPITQKLGQAYRME